MSASNYSLKINRDLLDPGFESYRLSPDAVPVWQVALEAGESAPRRRRRLRAAARGATEYF